jgi:hypothetical protein
MESVRTIVGMGSEEASVAMCGELRFDGARVEGRYEEPLAHERQQASDDLDEPGKDLGAFVQDE